MLYILGGVSRNGKSIIARKLLLQRAIPYLSTDALVTALQEGASNLGIRNGQQFALKAKKIWPIVKSLMEYQIYGDKNYLIEGDAILPSQISELINSHPHKIKVCFVGFSEISPQNKLKKIREYKRGKYDWTEALSDRELLNLIKDMINISKYLKRECQKYNLPYFDSSKNFQEYRKKVFQYFIQVV